MGKRVWISAIIATIIIVVLLLAFRSPHMDVTIGERAGFWQGFAHGYLIMINLVRSFFDRNIGVYEVQNAGHWYNIGFWLGQCIWFASGKISTDWVNAEQRDNNL